jgi:ATP-dependent DNA ligase
MNLRHAPVRDGLPLSRVAEFDFSRYIVQEKLDGWRAFLDGDTGELIGRNHRFGFYRETFPGWFFDGELMPDGEFIAFDCLWTPTRGDVAGHTQITRLIYLGGAPVKAAHWVNRAHAIGFAAGIEASGGEGVVAKLADAPYGRGGWLRFKREFTGDFRVLSVDEEKNSAEVEAGDGRSVGRISGAGHCLPGQIIEVKAMQFTKAGKLRHGRFVRSRLDKTTAPSHQHSLPPP